MAFGVTQILRIIICGVVNVPIFSQFSNRSAKITESLNTYSFEICMREIPVIILRYNQQYLEFDLSQSQRYFIKVTRNSTNFLPFPNLWAQSNSDGFTATRHHESIIVPICLRIVKSPQYDKASVRF